MKRVFCILTCAMVGCGGGAKPEPQVVPVATSKPATDHRAPDIYQELGSVDPAKVQKAFDASKSAMMACFVKGAERTPTLSGDLKFFVRIAHNGATKYAFLEGGDLGDRTTEKCMLDLLGATKWPAPEGGEDAEARMSMGFDVHDTRPASPWSPDKVASVITGNKAVQACLGGTSGLNVTVYVSPEGKRGKVQSAGVSVTTKEAAEKADCVANAIVGLDTQSPGSWVAKTTIKL